MDKALGSINDFGPRTPNLSRHLSKWLVTSLAVLAIERDFSSKIDMDVVIDKFAASSRRILCNNCSSIAL